MPAQIYQMGRHDVEQGGISVCGCRVLTCVNPHFLLTNHGLMKVSQVVLGSCCQTLLAQYGNPSDADYRSNLILISSGLLTSTILLMCYMISARTFKAVRASLFVSVYYLLFKCAVRIAIIRKPFELSRKTLIYMKLEFFRFAGNSLQLHNRLYVLQLNIVHTGG